jgi:hypothetical protein
LFWHYLVLQSFNMTILFVGEFFFTIFSFETYAVFRLFLLTKFLSRTPTFSLQYLF